MKIKRAPHSILTQIVTSTAKSMKQKQLGKDSESKDAQRQFSEYLSKTPAAIEGHGGDKTTLLAALTGRDLGLSKGTVYNLMLIHFNPRCVPEWKVDDLQKKVYNAFRYGKNEPGCKLPEFDFFESGLQIESTSDAKVIRTITAEDLIRTEFKEPRWAIQNILPEGLTVLAGHPKIGKSWLAFSLSLAISGGGKALGNFDTSYGEVLYLALEDNQRRLKGRLEKLMLSQNYAGLKNLHLSESIPRFDKGGMQQLEEWLNRYPNCILVIIDTLARFSPALNTRLNSYDNDSRVLAELQRLALGRRIALVFITHLRKQQSNDPLEQVMGSMGITGTADSIWLLKRGRNECLGTLSITGRDIEEQELALQFEKDTCQWTSLGDAARHQLGQERKKIIEYLEESRVQAGPKEVAQALNMKEGNVKNLMRKMHASGQIIKKERGKYCVLSPGDDFSDFEPESLTPSNS